MQNKRKTATQNIRLAQSNGMRMDKVRDEQRLADAKHAAGKSRRQFAKAIVGKRSLPGRVIDAVDKYKDYKHKKGKQNMLDSEIRMRELKEQTRHNKAEEGIGKAGNVIRGISGIGSLLNHPKWYLNDPELAKQAGTLVANYPLGLPINKTQTGILDAIHQSALCVYWADGVLPHSNAFANDVSTDAVNVAARQIYAFLRYANSGARNYQAGDYIRYIIALCSINAVISYISKLLGIVNSYDALNRTVGRRLLIAHQIYPDDAYKNYSNYLGRLNALIRRVSVFAVPSSMSIFDRWQWLWGNVFKDIDSDKAPLHTFGMYSMYVWDSETSAFRAEPLHWDDGTTWDPDNPKRGLKQTTISRLLAMLSTAIDNLNLIEEIAVMVGDTLKAFGTNNIFKWEPLPWDTKIEPVYDVDILTQIHNMTVLGLPKFELIKGSDKRVHIPALEISAPSDGSISQPNITTEDEFWSQLDCPVEFSSFIGDDDARVPDLVHTQYKSNVGIFVDWHSTNPTVEEVLVGTRLVDHVTLSVTADGNKSSNYFFDNHRQVLQRTTLKICPTEIVYGFDIYNTSDKAVNYPDIDSEFHKPTILSNYVTLGRAATDTGASVELKTSAWSQFHYAPILHPVDIRCGVVFWSDTQSINALSISNINDDGDVTYLGDAHNAYNIPVTTLDRLHYVCAQSEFYSPAIAFAKAYKGA